MAERFVDLKISLHDKLTLKKSTQKRLKFFYYFIPAFDYSGGYFNPVLATSLKAGCEGHTLLEHALVYWIGACAGAVLSVYIYKFPAVQKFFKGTSEVNGDSIWAEKED